MNIKHKGNLTEEELNDCIKLYESKTGARFLPTYVPEQSVWISAFEEAKTYFIQQICEPL